MLATRQRGQRHFVQVANGSARHIHAGAIRLVDDTSHPRRPRLTLTHIREPLTEEGSWSTERRAAPSRVAAYTAAISSIRFLLTDDWRSMARRARPAFRNP